MYNKHQTVRGMVVFLQLYSYSAGAFACFLCFVWLRLDWFGFASLRFVSFRFVSFRVVSFPFVLVSFFCLVQFILSLCCFVLGCFGLLLFFVFGVVLLLFLFIIFSLIFINTARKMFLYRCGRIMNTAAFGGKRQRVHVTQSQNWVSAMRRSDKDRARDRRQ